MRYGFKLTTGILFALSVGACGDDKSKQLSVKPEEFHASADLPRGTLNRRNLIEFAIAHRVYEPKDEFSPQDYNDAPLVDRPFLVDIDMADPQNADLTKLYNYDQGKKIFKLYIGSGPIIIYLKTKKLPSETRSNAFGATAEVARSEFESFLIGPMSGFFGRDETIKPAEIGVFPLKMEVERNYEGESYAYVSKKYSFADLEKDIPMSPEKARYISRDLHLIVEGIITKNDDGVSVECQNSGTAATISSPFEFTSNKCYISARFTRIQITSPKAGILASWE